MPSFWGVYNCALFEINSLLFSINRIPVKILQPNYELVWKTYKFNDLSLSKPINISVTAVLKNCVVDNLRAAIKAGKYLDTFWLGD